MEKCLFDEWFFGPSRAEKIGFEAVRGISQRFSEAKSHDAGGFGSEKFSIYSKIMPFVPSHVSTN
jgi:hypothetical protein